ncbi:hypothetical protein [Oryza sativa Japonica Group]|uniref:Uncharacterized protein B1129G05.15 n=5 Tax=Oryza TaxID=4527 RepID=Q657B5_ORYSJ|nr:hypothetical protein [Oryza sativa Japonica Group]
MKTRLAPPRQQNRHPKPLEESNWTVDLGQIAFEFRYINVEIFARHGGPGQPGARRLAHGASSTAAAAAGVGLPGEHPPPRRRPQRARMPAKEETIVYEADPDALTVDLVDDPLVKEFRDKLVDEVLTIDAGDMEALFEEHQENPELERTLMLISQSDQDADAADGDTP